MSSVFDNEIIGAMARGIVDDMQAGLFRSGYSAIIRESHDASCAILTAEGALAAQKVVLPIHVGAFPAVIEGVLNRFPKEQIEPGDCFVSNSPWEGGSPHNPDFAVVSPVFFKDQLVAFTASIAHKSDIGGPAAGSCPATAPDMYSEGLHIPPVKLYVRGELNAAVETLISANSRTPVLVMGDLVGQAGVGVLGAQRVSNLFTRYGREQTDSSFTHQRTKTKHGIQETLRLLPDFEESGERFIDHDGVRRDTPIGIRVKVKKMGPSIQFDFRESDDQGVGPVNIRPHLLNACCAYVVLALASRSLEINQGVIDAFTITTRKGSIVDPHFPAPVNSYNTVMHAVIEAIFDAMSRANPELARADGGGGRAITLAHSLNGSTLIQYELLAGGTGAMLDYQGLTGCHCNQTNGKIGSLEMIETEFPVRVEEFSVLRESGGSGTHKGGNGFRRRYTQLQGKAGVTLRSSKHVIAPAGAGNGGTAQTGHCEIRSENGVRVLATMESGVDLPQGGTLIIETPGGGGYA